METSKIPQSKAERTAFVNRMFAGMPPAEKKTLSLKEQLKPLRGDLLAKRKEGYNFDQIAAALKSSDLKCDVSAATLRLFLASAATQRRAKLKKLAAKRAANLAAAKAAQPGNAGVTPKQGSV